MRREITLLIVILLAALGGAYWASLPYDAKTANQTVVFNLDDFEWVGLEYKDPAQTTRIYLNDGKCWVDSTITGTSLKFLGNENCREVVLANLTPLRATRDLGAVAQDQLAEYGLINSNVSFQINLKDASRIFEIGSRSFGTRSIFIRDTKTSQVYLIDDAPIQPFSSPKSRLFENKLTKVSFDDVSGAVISLYKGYTPQKIKLKHDQYDAKGVLTWAFEKDNDQKKSAKLNSWFVNLQRILITNYPDNAVKESLKNISPFLEVELFKKDRRLESLKLYKSPADNKYWLRNEFHTDFVEIDQTRAEQLASDIRTVFL